MNTDLPPDLQAAVNRLSAAMAELHDAERAVTLAALMAPPKQLTLL